MIVKNEEANLRELLPDIKPYVDEIVVCDTGSTDGTIAYAEEIGAKVVHYTNTRTDLPFLDDFAAARNVSLDACTAKWVLILDGDHRVKNLDDMTSIRARLSEADDLTCFANLLVEEDGGGGQLGCTFVFPNRPEIRWERHIHEQILVSMERAGCKKDRSGITVLHLARKDKDDHADRLRRNLVLLALDIQDTPDDVLLMYHMGLTHFGLGEDAEALSWLERFCELPLNLLTVMALVLVMHLRAKMGNGFGANLALERAITVAPNDPIVRLMTAERYAFNKNPYGVVAQLRGVEFHYTGVSYPVEECKKKAALLLDEATRAIGGPSLVI